MSDSELRDEDHVVRYIKPSSMGEDGRPDGSAFCLRSGEAGLSVNWLECFATKPTLEQVEEVRRLSRISMKIRGCLAQLNVGDTKIGARDQAVLRFERRPLPRDERHPADPSHCEIFGLPGAGSPQAALVGDLVSYCVKATHPAISNYA